MPTLSADVLRPFAAALFRSAGVPDADAERVARSLVEANLCGHDSHGVIRVVQYLEAIADGRFQPGAAFEVVCETPALLVVDAHLGMGQVQAHRMLGLLLTKARQVGLAAGTMKRCGHIGRLGEYGETAARAGFAFVATVNNHGYARPVAPPGGTEPRISTNPVCLAVPTAQEPVVLDISTSVCAEGKVRVAYNKGQRVPEGWLLDAQGRPTTDPSVLYNEPLGTILPLGGAQAYKGFGLGLLFDMLAGGLSGGPCSLPGRPRSVANAVFFLVLDVQQFAGAEHFMREVTDLANAVRSCPRAEGVGEILLPGDPERKERRRRSEQGVLLDEGTWKQICAAATERGVPIPQG
jgi:hydroxycarboxylate dehydrogenase B